MTTLEETIDNRLERAAGAAMAAEAVVEEMKVELEAAIALMIEAQMTEVGLLATITMRSEREEQEAMNDWSEWTADEAREYWEADQTNDETGTTNRGDREESGYTVEEHQETQWVWQWNVAHREMMGWNDSEYEPNGYLTRPTIPLGVPLATVIWTRAWEDIIKHIPVTMSHIASFGQIHTIPKDVNITGPPVIGVRI